MAGLRHGVYRRPSTGRLHGRGDGTPVGAHRTGAGWAAERHLRQRGRTHHRNRRPECRADRPGQSVDHRQHHRQPAADPRSLAAGGRTQAAGDALQPDDGGYERRNDGPGGYGADLSRAVPRAARGGEWRPDGAAPVRGRIGDPGDHLRSLTALLAQDPEAVDLRRSASDDRGTDGRRCSPSGSWRWRRSGSRSSRKSWCIRSKD